MSRWKRWLTALLGAAVLAAGGLWLLSQRQLPLTVTHYSLSTDKLSQPLRLAVLSDLHNGSFGEENRELVEAVAQAQPDLILICGDMVNDDDPEVSVALELCEELTGIAPVWYQYGNHEGTLQYDPEGPRVALDRYLQSRGVKVLKGGVYEFVHGEDTVSLLGYSLRAEEYRKDPGFRRDAQEFFQRNGYKLVMSHYPDLIWKALAREDFDLGLAGHYHGGQIVIPGVGGLYHGDEGFFPEYWGGLYELEKGVLILSRGLGSSGAIPRLGNDPELVVIDIGKTE